MTIPAMLSKHHDNSNFEEKTVTHHMGEINTPTKKKLIQNENTKTLLSVFEVKKISQPEGVWVEWEVASPAKRRRCVSRVWDCK